VEAAPLRSLARSARRAGARLAFWLHDDPYEFDYRSRVRSAIGRTGRRCVRRQAASGRCETEGCR
jgi:hypothetical protein